MTGKRPERRNDFRVAEAYAFWWRRLTSVEEDPDKTAWEVSSTIDLSAGGAAFYGGKEGRKVSPGDLLEFQLVIPGKPVFGIARVIRVRDTENESQPSLAVRFISIEPRDQDRIAKMVLSDGLGKRHE